MIITFVHFSSNFHLCILVFSQDNSAPLAAACEHVKTIINVLEVGEKRNQIKKLAEFMKLSKLSAGSVLVSVCRR